MTLQVKHHFVSALPDDNAGQNAGAVQPSHWNAALDATMATARVLGRLTASDGVIEELTAAQMASFVTSALSAVFLGIAATAASAAVLATPRAINGVNFDGSAAITITAAAGTLTGATLASSVTASSLLSAAGGAFGTAAFTAASAYDAAGTASSAIATHAALQTGVHGISIAAGKTLTASNSLTLTATDGSTLAIGTGGTLGSAAYLASTTSTTLAGNSDSNVPTERAVKAYVDASVTGLLDFKGSTDASANPSYPSALKGDAYYISVAGKIGGASGKSVDVGDVYVASADNAGGTEASVGTSWFVLEHNLVGAAVTSGTLAQFAATTSAQLAGVISDETGSGALVFATSPTFVTPLLGTPTSGNLANCTAYPASALSGSITASQGPTAVADGATLGFATFTAADFNAAAGVISLDYTNGQAADASHKGFLTAADWSTFNGKGAGTVTSIATTGPITGGTITGTGTIALNVATDHLFTAAQSITQAIAATSTTALTLATSSTATVGAQKWSGAQVFTGSGWSTTSVAAMAVNWKVELQPVQGAAAPSANLVFSSQIAGGGYTAQIQMTSAGQLVVPAGSASFSASVPQIYFGNTSAASIWSDNNNGVNLSATNGGSDLWITGNVARLRSAGALQWSSSTTTAVAGPQTFIISPSAAVIQQGTTNAASPVAQTLQAQGSRGGTDSNVGGADYTHASGQGTGTGTASSLIVKAPTVAASGSGAQTMTEIVRFNTTNGVKIASGVALVLGNAATTGLSAGALAATTNASIVLTDSSGQAYRIPCII